VADTGMTLAGYAGTDPVRIAVIESVRALFLTARPGTGEPPVIEVRQEQDRLDLLAGGYQLTCQRQPEALRLARPPPHGGGVAGSLGQGPGSR